MLVRLTLNFVQHELLKATLGKESSGSVSILDVEVCETRKHPSLLSLRLPLTAPTSFCIDPSLYHSCSRCLDVQNHKATIQAVSALIALTLLHFDSLKPALVRFDGETFKSQDVVDVATVLADNLGAAIVLISQQWFIVFRQCLLGNGIRLP